MYYIAVVIEWTKQVFEYEKLYAFEQNMLVADY